MPQPERITPELPGSGGRLLSIAEDFRVVEELPFAPTGEGDHCFVVVEKTDLSTLEAAWRLLEAAGLPKARSLPPELGFAGLKDRSAIAEQTFSLPFQDGLEARLSALDTPELKVLRVTRHPKKLKRGQLRSNRFDLRIREVPEGGVARAQNVLKALTERGLPGRFGPQRFGKDQDNAKSAIAILQGKRRPPRERRLRDLFYSALQAEIFNAVLDLRIQRGLLSRALLGDIMQKHDTHGLFEVTDPAAEQERVAGLEISPTGPLPGKKMRAAQGEAAQLEAEVIQSFDLAPDMLARLGPGTRRPMRIPLDPEARIEAEGNDSYRVTVRLPAGHYATVLLDELVKPAGEAFRRAPQDNPERAL